VIEWKVLGRAEQTALAWVRARSGESILQWLRVWRWPAGLVAGVVLWVALVAVVGAATPSWATHATSGGPSTPGGGDTAPSMPASCSLAGQAGYNSNVINLVYSFELGGTSQ